jgi:hypothetical protein
VLLKSIDARGLYFFLAVRMKALSGSDCLIYSQSNLVTGMINIFASPKDCDASTAWVTLLCYMAALSVVFCLL